MSDTFTVYRLHFIHIGIISGIVYQIGIFVSIQHIYFLRNSLPAIISIIRNRSTSFLAFLSSNQYYTIRSSRTINGSRRSIFQYLNRLYIIHIEGVQLLLGKRYPVYYIQGGSSCSNSARTTYLNL